MNTAKYYLSLILNIAVPVGGLCLLIFVLPRLLVFFMPFVLGYFVAFLANPLVTMLQKKISLKRRHSSFFITVLVLAAVVLVLYLIISRLFAAGSAFVQELPAMYEDLIASLQGLAARYSSLFERMSPDLMNTIGSLTQNLDATISELLSKLASPTVSLAGSAVRSVPTVFIYSLIFFLSAFCFITEWESIQAFLRRHTPAAVSGYLHYLKEDLKRILGSWLLAQFKIMFVVFAVLMAGFLVLRVKHFFLIAVLTAFLDFLPAFGVGFILWPWIAFSLLQGKFFFAFALAVIYVLTQAVRQILQPKIMGDTMGLPPLWTLFFLFVGYRFYGLAGMIFSLPIGMLFLSVYRYGLFDGMLGAAGELARDIGELMHKTRDES